MVLLKYLLMKYLKKTFDTNEKYKNYLKHQFFFSFTQKYFLKTNAFGIH